MGFLSCGKSFGYGDQSFDQRMRDWGYQCDLWVLPEIGHSDELIYNRIGTKDFRFYRELFGK